MEIVGLSVMLSGKYSSKSIKINATEEINNANNDIDIDAKNE
ncbi:9982_t:CDS:2 [Racocetra fulgida]|uniref:9982_t:CDS:1 n=1 Tax=Racocetra fulgida TaxID=60492 RepID=A0A9N9F7W8_9GLOM|nr:9982_t:CDS:2 [Racocetra fulgida]